MNLETIKTHFSIIRDERQSAKVDYPLFDISFGSICAVTKPTIRAMKSRNIGID